MLFTNKKREGSAAGFSLDEHARVNAKNVTNTGIISTK